MLEYIFDFIHFTNFTMDLELLQTSTKGHIGPEPQDKQISTNLEIGKKKSSMTKK